MADLEALVASPWWRWMPGMLDTSGARYQWRHENQQAEALTSREGAALWIEPGSDLPDLTDPATLGCLLALMYEAEPQHITPNPVSVCLSQHGLTDPRTVDAIVSAILAAPPPGVFHG